MRDILSFHFNRLEGEVIFVDPKNGATRSYVNSMDTGKRVEML